MATTTQDYLNAALEGKSLNPFSFLVPQSTLDQWATFDPAGADKGKLNPQLLAERALGNTLNLPNTVFLNPVGSLAGSAWDWLSGRVGEEPAVAPPPPAPADAGSFQPFPLPGLGQSISQAPGGMPSEQNRGGFQLPEVPKPAMADYGGFVEAMQGLGPAAPAGEEIYQRPDPIAPNTGVLEGYISGMTAPAGPDLKARQQTNMMSILGAIARGASEAAQRGGDWSLVLGQAGARTAEAYAQNAQRVAEEDQTFQQQKQIFEQSRMQAQMSLEQIRQQYAQAVQDTQSGNAELAVGARNRAAEAQARFVQAQRDWQLRVMETGLRAQEAQAAAATSYMNAVFDRDTAQLRINADAAKPFVADGKVYVNGPGGLQRVDGSMNGGFKQYLDLAKLPGMLPEVKNELELQGNFMYGLESQQPAVLQKVIARSLIPQAPAILGEQFEDVQAAIAKKAFAAGVLPGTVGYPDFYEAALTEELLLRLNGEGSMTAVANDWGNIYAKKYLQVTAP